MKQWLVLFGKEMLEMWRNFKWIWIPLVFIILGLIDPLTMYYLPKILEAAGGLPDGSTFEMPVPTGPEVVMMSVGQFTTLGTLVIVLAAMGMIAAERRSGVASMILVKPVPYVAYVTSKWAALVLIGLVSLALGFVSSSYYTGLLFESIPFQHSILALLIFALWYVFILTIVIFYNAIVRSSGLVVLYSLLTIILLSVLTSTFDHWLKWSPAQLTGHVSSVLVTGQVLESFWMVVLLTVVLIGVLIIAAVGIFKRKELA